MIGTIQKCEHPIDLSLYGRKLGANNLMVLKTRTKGILRILISYMGRCFFFYSSLHSRWSPIEYENQGIIDI